MTGKSNSARRRACADSFPGPDRPCLLIIIDRVKVARHIKPPGSDPEGTDENCSLRRMSHKPECRRQTGTAGNLRIIVHLYNHGPQINYGETLTKGYSCDLLEFIHASFNTSLPSMRVKKSAPSLFRCRASLKYSLGTRAR